MPQATQVEVEIANVLAIRALTFDTQKVTQVEVEIANALAIQALTFDAQRFVFREIANALAISSPGLNSDFISHFNFKIVRDLFDCRDIRLRYFTLAFSP